MAGALGSLVVTLGLDAAEFTRGLSKAEYQAKQWRDETIKSARQVGAIMGTAAVAAAAALAALTKSAINSADDLGKLAQKTGITAESLSGLKYAGDLSGVSLESLSGGLTKLSRSMSEAADGTGAQADAFRALGVEVKNSDGSLRATDAVLADVAQKFSEYADSAEKTALAQAIFGKSGADLIPLLNLGSAGLKEMRAEAERLGIVMSADLTKAAEEFNDTLTKIGTVTQAIGIQLAKELLPALQAVADEMLRAREETGAFASIAGGVRTAFEALVIVGANVAFTFKYTALEVYGLGRQLAALAQLDFKGFSAISDAMKADAARARAELDAFERRVMGFKEPRAFRPSDNYGEGMTPAKRSAPRLRGSGGGKGSSGDSEAQRYLENLQKQIEKSRELSVVEQATADIQAKRIKGITPALERQILLAAAEVDAARNLAKAKDEEARAREGVAAIIQRNSDALIKETEGLIEGNQALRDEIAILQGGEEARKAIEQARLSSAIALKEETLAMLQNADAGQEEIAALEQQIRLLKERADLLGKRDAASDKPEDPFKGYGDDASHARDEIEGFLGQGLYDAMNGNFKSIGDSFAQMLSRMVAEAAAAQIMQAMFGASSGRSGAGLESLFSGLIGSFSGGGFSAPPTGGYGITSGLGGKGLVDFGLGAGRAGGGSVRPGGVHEVGEKRPEMLDVNGRKFLLMGKQRGTIDPMPQMRSGRQTVINAPITVNMPRNVSEQTMNQAGAAVARRMNTVNRRFN